MNDTEGVIKYVLEHTPAPLPVETRLDELIAWHQVCHRLDLLGQHDDRYDGYAYGNISQRGPAGFIISGTQTAGNPRLTADDFAFVNAWSTADNRIVARGPCRPSSEALTHAAVYDLMPAIRFVIHVHCPEIWRQSTILALKQTREDIAYGTPAMAEEVGRLFANHPEQETGVFSMPGHEDGVVVFGPDAATTGAALTTLLARALASFD